MTMMGSECRGIIRAAALSLAVFGLAASAAQPPKARALNVFNLDSTHYTYEYGDDKMNAQGLREYVHRVLGKGAFTHFFICPGAQVTLVDTKTMSPSWWRMGEPGVPLNDHMRRNHLMFTNGVDIIRVEIDAIRAHGVSPWLSMRMNDNHYADEPKCWLHSKFWVEHPRVDSRPAHQHPRKLVVRAVMLRATCG